MHRTQILLEDRQYERLVQESQQRGISLSALIRSLIAEHLNGTPGEKLDPLEKLTGMAEGSGEAVGRHHNRYLYGQDK